MPRQAKLGKKNGYWFHEQGTRVGSTLAALGSYRTRMRRRRMPLT